MNARRFMIILKSNLLLNGIATVYRLQPIGAFTPERLVLVYARLREFQLVRAIASNLN